LEWDPEKCEREFDIPTSQPADSDHAAAKEKRFIWMCDQVVLDFGVGVGEAGGSVGV
jgi:hypothetical protein